jgi:probable rRNA maturation factor
MIRVELAQQQETHRVDAPRLKRAAREVIASAGFKDAEISIAVVDDARMHTLNRQYLRHDYPTDVLSFVLEQDQRSLEGEIIVSADYAAREAERFNWSVNDELLLYVIHGSLHLIGYDDQTPEAKAAMRAKEVEFLGKFNLAPRFDAEL